MRDNFFFPLARATSINLRPHALQRTRWAQSARACLTFDARGHRRPLFLCAFGFFVRSRTDSRQSQRERERRRRRRRRRRWEGLVQRLRLFHLRAEEVVLIKVVRKITKNVLRLRRRLRRTVRRRCALQRRRCRCRRRRRRRRVRR